MGEHAVVDSNGGRFHGVEVVVIRFREDECLTKIVRDNSIKRIPTACLRHKVPAPSDAEGKLRQELDNYMAFLNRGGTKGSEAGRAYRGRVGSLIAKVHNERSKTLRITDDEMDAAVAAVEVF